MARGRSARPVVGVARDDVPIAVRLAAPRGADGRPGHHHVPWGQAPGREALWGYVGEALVHGRDLAVAIGQPCEADPALVEPTVVGVRRFLPADARLLGVPFSTVEEPRAEAGPTERLANWAGRSADGWV